MNMIIDHLPSNHCGCNSEIMTKSGQNIKVAHPGGCELQPMGSVGSNQRGPPVR